MAYKNLLITLLATMAALFSMTACSNDGVEDAADEAGDAIEKGADSLEDGAEKIGDEVKDATN